MAPDIAVGLSRANDTRPRSPSSHQVPTDDITAELETIQAALDDCRADLNERTRQLYAVQDQAEVYSQAAASRAAAQASASAKSLAKAMRETDTAREAGEELLRRAKGEAEAIREEEGITAATALAETVAAAEKARARDAMDLVAVAREKDVLREKCVWLEARLSEMQVIYARVSDGCERCVLRDLRQCSRVSVFNVEVEVCSAAEAWPEVILFSFHIRFCVDTTFVDDALYTRCHTRLKLLELCKSFSAKGYSEDLLLTMLCFDDVFSFFGLAPGGEARKRRLVSADEGCHRRSRRDRPYLRARRGVPGREGDGVRQVWAFLLD